MKKAILLLLTLLMITPIAYNAYGDDNDGPEKISTPIIIIKGKKPQRSLTEEVTAAYYPAERIIEIEFNENIGTVDIKVTNAMGTIVYNAMHDTSVEVGCTIDIPQQGTTYTIDITGSEYAGVGYLYL